MEIIDQILSVGSYIIGLPLMIFVVLVGIIYTFALKGIQFRYFFHAWKEALVPSGAKTTGDMTPMQAFLNTLNMGIGNGSLAGVGTAIYAGGPGSAFWMLFFGFILMSVRFMEVYVSTLYGARIVNPGASTLGGPMLYLRNVIGGKFLAYIYALSCVFFGLAVGNAVQANSIALSLFTTWGVNKWYVACAVFALVAYIILGGAPRIIKFSERIVPIKVIVFFSSALLIILYHWTQLIPACMLILKSAFSSQAVIGGATGFAVQQAIRYGMNRSIMATESGLGTAAILFGFTGSKDPMRNGLMGMITTFISTLVCFLVALCIVVSGVWNSGLTSTELTIASYNTLFGVYGGWIVSFLAITFGIGVLVTYAYIVRAAWLYLTGGRLVHVFTLAYPIAAFAGALVNANAIFDLGDIPMAILLFTNLFGLLMLLPRIQKDILSSLSAH